MPWAVIGWPLVVAAIAAFGVAFSTRHTWAGFAGALIAAPLGHRGSRQSFAGEIA
jgi:hypothetical protein